MFRRTTRLGAVLPWLARLGIVRLTHFLPAHPELPPQKYTGSRGLQLVDPLGDDQRSGVPCHADHMPFFDPERYRISQFDQRGGGRSQPLAGDPATDLSVNTTHDRIADMERLREHLGVERWLLFGGSCGSTLSLACAEQYPHRVSEILLAPVTTRRHCEIHWALLRRPPFLP